VIADEYQTEAVRPQVYRVKPFEVQAMRWQPGDLAAAGAMVDWLMGNGVDFNHPSGSGSTTTLSLHESGTLAEPGWWVVRRCDGWTFALSPERFAELYEPIGA
jgi:hypothetical protein